MAVNFLNINKSSTYSRNFLATVWGYKNYRAIARGVVTPKNSNIIILFVTENKQSTETQYQDRLVGKILEWEGPTQHAGEQRIINAKKNGDVIHLFHRPRHHMDFTYCGVLEVIKAVQVANKPSRFEFEVK